MKSKLAVSPVEQLQTSAARDHEWLRHVIAEASEPIAQFWPMKNFVHHNPIHGLEHLPFDEAVREAKQLLGGNGYLSNKEYRDLYRQGRITDTGVRRALYRTGPRISGQAGPHGIEAFDVLRAHLLFGIDPLELPSSWTFGPGGALRRFQADVPAESRQRILERWGREAGAARRSEERYLRELWDASLQAVSLIDNGEPQVTIDVSLPHGRTLGDWIDTLAGSPIVEQVNEQLMKWVAPFVDEGIAGWQMPSRHLGFYHAWRDLAPRDFSGRFLGIRNFAQKVRGLPEVPEDAIMRTLDGLGVPPERWTEYLSRHLAQLPGWSGFIRWLSENPDYPDQAGHPTRLVDYLAVRLFYEAEIAGAVASRKWKIDGTVPAVVSHWQPRAEEYRSLMSGERPDGHHNDPVSRDAWRLFRLAQFLELTPGGVRELTSRDIHTMFGWLDAFPEDTHGPVWLEAYEDKYREELIAKVAPRNGSQPAQESRPRAQIVFCIDVRSESMRRHVEAQGPYETLGYAGFFGVAMNHQAFDSHERFPLCPVLLKPSHAVNEAVRPGQDDRVNSYASGTRWWRLGDQLFHDLKQNPGASFILVDILGLFFSIGLAGKTLIPRVYEEARRRIRDWFHPSLATRISVDRTSASENGGARTFGFTLEEQANMVEGGLRATGLTRNFGRFIVLCGHGSVTDNNPYFGALHCGACGGKHGDPNARAFASMGNNPQVRRLLRQRGLELPDDTWLLAGKHVTTSDRILFYDVEDVPATHRDDLTAMIADLEKAGAAQAAERCTRIPQAPKAVSPKKAYNHVLARCLDWSNTRPEWGLSSNAAFLIGRRKLTKQVNLQGRVFLHSYDAAQDPEGKILEKLMTAPLIVGEWINMEHYFSGVDPWFWGSGSKVIHNVVGGVGVIPGSQGDLLTGLPLQTVNNGEAHYHEPMRLLTIIEAPADRISSIISKHTLLQHLFHNQWVNLIAIDPFTYEILRYNPDQTWDTLPLTASEKTASYSEHAIH